MEPLDRKYRSPQGHRFRAAIASPMCCRDCGFEMKEHTGDVFVEDILGQDAGQGMVCDFCRDPDPTCEIPCRTFRVRDVVDVFVPITSLGAFMACVECWTLVIAEDHEGLFARARQSLIRRAMWDPELELPLRAFYEQFWENREK